MRRVTGFVLTALGTFLIVVAALLRFWIAPSADKFPLNEYHKLTLSGTGSYFSEALLGEQTDVRVGVTYTVIGDTSLGTGSTAVYNLFTSVQDLTDQQPISYIAVREAWNRSNEQLVDCCGEYITNPVPPGHRNNSPHMSGLGAFFPQNTKAQTYTIYDTTAGKPESAAYEGGASVKGLLTYKFVETVAPTKIGTDSVPGIYAGEPLVPSVTLGEYYSATNTFYVDPVTGAPLDIVENQTITLGSSPANVAINASQISVIETAQSVASSVSSDQTTRSELRLLNTILPLSTLGVGIVLLVLGIILVWLGGERDESDPRLMHELDTYA